MTEPDRGKKEERGGKKWEGEETGRKDQSRAKLSEEKLGGKRRRRNDQCDLLVEMKSQRKTESKRETNVINRLKRREREVRGGGKRTHQHGGLQEKFKLQ